MHYLPLFITYTIPSTAQLTKTIKYTYKESVAPPPDIIRLMKVVTIQENHLSASSILIDWRSVSVPIVIHNTSRMQRSLPAKASTHGASRRNYMTS